jgi:hypothetical protein
MRWVAGVLATIVAALQLALFTGAQLQLQAASSAVGVDPQAPWLRWVWAVAWSLPWLVGAGMIVAGRLRGGVAVIVTAGLLLLTSSFGGLAPLLDGSVRSVPTETEEFIAAFGGGLLWVLALVTVACAVATRPPGPWRVDAPGPVGPYVAASVFAWLPAAFETTAFAPPEAMRAFAELQVGQLVGLDAAANLATAGAVAVVLFVACRLRPDVGGAVLLTFAVPRLLAELDAVVRVNTEEFVIFTPAGVLGLLGLAGAVVIGVTWATTEVRVHLRSP